jgi:hypothetical protein
LSISKILSSKYEYLDIKDPKKDKKELEGTKRSSDRDWPVLEAALFEWHQGMLRCKANGQIAGLVGLRDDSRSRNMFSIVKQPL